MVDKIAVYSFYRFIEIKNLNFKKNKFLKSLGKKNIKGTIIISSEGINASISGIETDLKYAIKITRQILNIKKISLKINYIDFIPFYKFRVRIKNEIVSLGKKIINSKKNKNNFIDPSNWDSVVNNKDITLIDLRNSYEIEIGSFQGAINPNTNSFREFPKALASLELKKDKKIAIFCTGGIRCEKASIYMKNNGYENVIQLDGGILNYLSKTKNLKNKRKWFGDCFVFDNRVAVNSNLEKSNYLQCYGCRMPITKKDTLTNYYKKGIHCPKCYSKRSSEQIRNSETRQRQIDNAELKNLPHSFSKITLKDIIIRD